MIFFESILIERLPFPFWIEDASELKQYFETLRKNGINDISQLFLTDEYHFIQQCIRKIKLVRVNQYTLDLFEASSCEELEKNLASIFRDDMLPYFKQLLIDLWQGQLFYSDTVVNYTLSGKRLNLELHALVIPGYEDTLGRVLISTIDVTEQIQTQKLGQQNQLISEAIFQYAPVAMLICDCKAIKKRFDYLHEAGIENFESYIQSNSQFVDECLEQIKILNTNKALLDLFKLKGHQEYIDHREQIYQGSLYQNFMAFLTHLWHGKPMQEHKFVAFTLDNNVRYLLLHYNILPSYKNSWEKVQICLTDITEKVQIESFHDVLKFQNPITKFYNEKFLNYELKRIQKEFMFQISCIQIKLRPSSFNHSKADDYSCVLLSRLSDIIHYMIKKPLTAYHLKNNDFLILIPGCDNHLIQQKINGILSLIEIDQDFYQSIPLEIDIGHATLYPNETLEQMLLRADQNLYNNKFNAQKNQTFK
ncbi:diguanylate cyclase [Acinetobacter qingfengensis]|uniref:GGDEF domain-containing protein n=1 Tax=Acinetobacter qingfengensis TaxID=1262585 RepID=A0A1E7R569_9GAMM|nr:diguanylate cyclase [Acinetobacter qingfengensis]KAA8730932.1 diguanylate cyclase [Acinetobacter qingfengensis]OEY94470.1 hypothetical protein BJI46_03790 [Acinetobacter qingfengensis]